MTESSRLYNATEVLQLLGESELLEDELRDAVDLDAESEDEDSPEDDGTDIDGSPMLLPRKYLAPELLEIAVQSFHNYSPAERDSLLLTDSDLNAEDSECCMIY